MNRREFLTKSFQGMAAMILADAFILEPHWIEWTQVPLVPREKASTPVKFVQVSDLHIKSLSSNLIDAADKINAIKPDLLFLTGDSVNRQKELPFLDEFMDVIDLSIPKIAVLGNWERWGGVNVTDITRIYERHNCRLLVNESESYTVNGKKIQITGVDDYIAGDANLKLALENYKDNDYHVLLNHCPEYRDLMMDHVNPMPKIDVVLSGHTHGGQINFLGYIPVLPPGSGQYIKGWYGKNNPPLYVSRGVGTSVAPVRFSSLPEITTFHVNI